MPKIEYLPSGITIETQDGATLLDTALDHGISIQHACGGFCACTTCHCEIIEGQDHISKIDEDEAERLEFLEGRTPHSRLGCQTRVYGDIKVRVMNPDD